MNSCWVVVAHTLIPALRRKKQADLCEFEASLVYIVTRTLQDSQGCYTEKLCLAKLKKKKHGFFYTVCGNEPWYTNYGGNQWESQHVILGMFRKMKSMYKRHYYIPMLIVALWIMEKNQPTCPSTNECLEKNIGYLCYILVLFIHEWWNHVTYREINFRISP